MIEASTSPLVRRRASAARVQERAAYAVLATGTACVIGPIVWIFGFIAWHGIRRITPAFLTGYPEAGTAQGGLFPALLGTMLVMVGTIAIALPMGILGAVYLTEYAGKSRWVRIVRMAIVNLAGVPSIVHGLFGLGFFVLFVGGGIDRYILRSSGPVWGQPCLLWGCCTLAAVVLPVIITSTEEALRAVPISFREASLGLGATRWQTIRRVVLPAALPGILTGAILGVGRAAGETAPVMVTCAASYMPWLPRTLHDQTMLLPYHLYFVVTQVPNPSLDLEAGIALVLVAMVAAISLLATLLRAQARRARRW